VRVVATAGHVDHGKSTLVKFLTGTDPDRLAEEKRRGLTIDLGFGAATLPSGQEAAFVDVPGHARFIKNMLAGVGATDACVFVVAANEGWQPQSEEHLRILELLGLRHGMVALTKVALAGEELATLAEMEVVEHVTGTFLDGAPIVPVDVVEGVGVSGESGLPSVLDRVLAETPGATDVGRPRLWVDRSFAMRGSGTVVTGSLTGGPIASGDHLVLRPSDTQVRVRALQSHGRELDLAGPGRRLAVNLAGVAHSEVARGEALVRGPQWHRAKVIDASLTVLDSVEREITRRGAYLAYFGSGEHPVRLRTVGGQRSVPPGETGWVRLWLPVPLPLVPGDRFILRDAGPQQTIGGGEVLDVAPWRPASRARPSRSTERVISERGWVDVEDLARLTGKEVTATFGHWVASPAQLAEWSAGLRARVETAGPMGLDVAALDERQRHVLATLDGVVTEHGRARVARSDGGSEAEDLSAHPFLLRLRAEPFSPPAPEAADRAYLRALERHGLAFERDGVWFAASALDQASAVLWDLLDDHPEGVSVSDVRSALGTSRKYAMPLLAHMDATGMTRRRGDLRVAGPRLPPRE
jgi:selenocysteine-specific elongation factor